MNSLEKKLDGFKKCEFYEIRKKGRNLEFFFAYKNTKENEELFKETIKTLSRKVGRLTIVQDGDE